MLDLRYMPISDWLRTFISPAIYTKQDINEGRAVIGRVRSWLIFIKHHC